MSKPCTCPGCGKGMVVREFEKFVYCYFCKAVLVAQAVRDMEDLKERKAA